MIYFSKSSMGFFDSNGLAKIPKDAVKITNKYHEELLIGQSSGKVIDVDEKGFPILIENPGPSIEYLETQVKRTRDKLLSSCDYIIMPDYPLEDKTPWLEYRQLLRDITEQSGYPTEVVWPEKPDKRY